MTRACGEDDEFTLALSIELVHEIQPPPHLRTRITTVLSAVPDQGPDRFARPVPADLVVAGILFQAQHDPGGARHPLPVGYPGGDVRGDRQPDRNRSTP